MFYPLVFDTLTNQNPYKKFANNLQVDLHDQLNDIGKDRARQLKLINHIISHWFKFDVEPYKKSSWFANKMLYETNGIDYLLYPSAANLGNSCNWAIHPNIVDNYLKLKKILCLKIKELDLIEKDGLNNLKLSFEKREVGEIINTNINWRMPNDDDFEFLPNKTEENK